MNKQKIVKIVRKTKILFKLFSKVLRILNPSYSYCEKCGLPWNWCKSKAVDYSNGSGTFATCQYCWEHSSLNELKRCYKTVYNKQRRDLLSLGYNIDHTLEHLLDCVEKQYYETHPPTKDFGTALKYIVENEYGSIEELEKFIDKDLIDQMFLIGFLTSRMK